MQVRPAIIPCLWYRDAPAAIAFLCEGFGFECRAVHADDQDPSLIHHAELVREHHMIMLSSQRCDTEFTRKARALRPEDAGGNTQGIYIVLDEVDSHAARARAAGARIILEPADQDYGGRTYTALDPEGHVWSFGSYDPWAAG